MTLAQRIEMLEVELAWAKSLQRAIRSASRKAQRESYEARIAQEGPCGALWAASDPTTAQSLQSTPQATYEQEFGTLWAIYPKRHNNARKLALKAYIRRRNEGVEHAYLYRCTQNYAKWVRKEEARASARGLEFDRNNKVMQAATFYGPNGRYEPFEDEEGYVAPSAGWQDERRLGG